MKIILSRKGLDSSFGSVPSPILPDGRLVPVPIPEIHRPEPSLPTLADLSLWSGPPDISTADLMTQVSRGKMNGSTTVHLDPDLDSLTIARRPGWRGAFGQSGAAERHLQNQGVTIGDLFLFFGWFRQVECRNGSLRFVRGAEDVHVLFGYLQIGEICPVDRSAEFPDWLRSHPHAVSSACESLDTIYIGADQLSVPGVGVADVPGFGRFRRYHDDLRLTAPGRSRSIWRLPADFMPGERAALSYHQNESRWTRADDGSVLLRSVGRGQEFVVDGEEYPGVQEWALGILDQHARELIV